MNGHSGSPPVDLGRALLMQRLATQVVMELAVRIEEHLPPRAELLAVVADDVVGRWVAYDGVGRRPELFGSDGFIATYVDTVERGRPGRIGASSRPRTR